MENDNYLKQAGFALVATAIALSTGAAKASDKESWVWEDRGDRRIAIVEPVPDVVYRTAPLRVVYTRPVTRRVIYTRPAVREVIYRRPALRRVIYSKPVLFPSYRRVRYYTGKYQYAPVSGPYVQNVSYLEYR